MLASALPVASSCALPGSQHSKQAFCNFSLFLPFISLLRSKHINPCCLLLRHALSQLSGL